MPGIPCKCYTWFWFHSGWGPRWGLSVTKRTVHVKAGKGRLRARTRQRGDVEVRVGVVQHAKVLHGQRERGLQVVERGPVHVVVLQESRIVQAIRKPQYADCHSVVERVTAKQEEAVVWSK